MLVIGDKKTLLVTRQILKKKIQCRDFGWITDPNDGNPYVLLTRGP